MREIASAWEAQCVAETRRRCERTAAAIGGLATIGLNAEDAAQQFSIAVVEACRHWSIGHEDKPSPAYLNMAIRRRKLKLWTAIRRATERGYQTDDNHEAVEDEVTLGPDDMLLDHERQSQAGGWETLVKHRLSPAEFALLKLRASGWSNTEIAEATGISREGDEVHGLVRRRVWAARKKASDFLRSCGIDGVEEALEASQEIRHGAWEKVSREGL
jgi:DNA-directed RNA polymerase specialized sigma24 family protein